ncbi:MAG: acetamidase/formamidase family protein [Mesorhizobium sp.]
MHLRTVHGNHHHHGWNRDNQPAVRVAPGSVLDLEVLEVTTGQLTPRSVAADLLKIDNALANPLTGPVAVDGAEPGDTLVVTIHGFMPSGWGWTGIIPSFGLLARDFTEPVLHHWHYSNIGKPTAFGDFARVPLRPFPSTIGVAMAEAGTHGVMLARNNAGNINIRQLVEGGKLYIPVQVKDALFSVGDIHAAQGDGEVCGAAIESPMTVSLGFELVKKENLVAPRITTPAIPQGWEGRDGYEITTGMETDLYAAARAAVSRMIDLLCRRHGLKATDAYMLCSVAGDLRISSAVIEPHWVVTFHLPRAVLC